MTQALQRYERTAALLLEVRKIATARKLTPEALWVELNSQYLSAKDAISVSTAVKVLKKDIKPVRSELFAALLLWVAENNPPKPL